MVLSGAVGALARAASFPFPSARHKPAPMNAPLPAQVLLRAAEPDITAATQAAAGVIRYEWEGKFGSMLIEVIGEEIYVNGSRVLRHLE